MELAKYNQLNPVNSEVEALMSVVSPILRAILLSLKRDIVDKVGGYNSITLELLARLYRQGDGDCGICFEYAVHDAIIKNNPDVLNRIDHALINFCKITQGKPTSILFGAEKSGAMQLIESVTEHLTDDSYLLTGNVGQPIKLKKHIQGVINAFRKPSEREKLPSSINGLWKADLFIGKTEPDKWVGTTVKINPKQLESARGLRLAIIPGSQGKSDKIYKLDTKNLIICPIPYDESFVEIFYQAWAIVKYFLNADAKLPKEDLLPRGAERLVCKHLYDRRSVAVFSVIESLDILSQPDFIEVEEQTVGVEVMGSHNIQTDKLIAPVAQI